MQCSQVTRSTLKYVMLVVFTSRSACFISLLYVGALDLTAEIAPSSADNCAQVFPSGYLESYMSVAICWFSGHIYILMYYST